VQITLVNKTEEIMFNKRVYALVLALIVILSVQAFAQAQEVPPTDIATQLRYLETYNIPELRVDPLWYTATHHGLSLAEVNCVCAHGYLATYNIHGLEDDPMWRGVLAEYALVDNTDL
jgi:hypothetical protein